MIQKEISVWGQRKLILGDVDYLGAMGDEFEPETTSLLAVLCDADATAVDIGANIGLTSLALSDICHEGEVIAIEPVPNTFALLNKNLAQAGAGNVSTYNVAAGAGAGMVSMYVNEQNLATSFIVSDADAGGSKNVPVTSLDALTSERALQRLDFIKIDVEGFELEVLKGARETLDRFKPIVMMEMNHWCLNVFRRIPLPDFREAVLQIFPYVYAVDNFGYLDFTDPVSKNIVYHAHVTGFRYMNLVAGFDKDEIVARLDRWQPPVTVAPAPVEITPIEVAPVEMAPIEVAPIEVAPVVPVSTVATDDAHAEAMRRMEEELQTMLNSHSWKLTAPLRRLGAWARSMAGRRFDGRHS